MSSRYTNHTTHNTTISSNQGQKLKDELKDPISQLEAFNTKCKHVFTNFIKIFGSLLIIMFINIVGNFICYMYECSYWSHLFHHDLLCNACIDFSKMMKDHQITIYIAIGTLIINELRTLFN